MNKLLAACLLLLLPAITRAQYRQQRDPAIILQDSLAHIGKRMINNSEELERKNANYEFIRTLIATLKLPNSYHFAFDSLKTVTLVNSPDNRFRIFTWHVMNDDGSYRFYGTIQMNTGNGPLVLHPLGDYTPLMRNPEDTVTDNTKWYGAQYYQIVPVGGSNPYYVLLGWKGNTPKSTKKVIEVLSFKNGRAVFGMPVFPGKLGVKDRVVFEYARQASMLLKYDPEHRLIVFDHLAPPDKKFAGQPETFGPDLSYDGYKLTSEGAWRLEENLDMRNLPSASDAQYIDPKTQKP